MSRPGPRALRVLVTRPTERDDDLAALLKEGGARVEHVPLTRIQPPADTSALRDALHRLDTFDWVVFTSANAVGAVAALAPPSVGSRVRRVAAVGPATARAVEQRLGWTVAAVPMAATGAAIVPAMQSSSDVRGAPVLWPRAEHALPDLRNALLAAGSRVEDPVAYRTVPDPDGVRRVADRIASGEIDVIVLMAPSAVRAFASAGVPVPPRTRVAMIGPTTARAAQEAGLRTDIVGADPSVAALARAILQR